MKYWIISDTHFNDPAMVHYCGRPENHTDITVKNCRNLIGKDDVLIHLGDVIFQRASELKGYLDQIPGKKWLVRGNHDQRSDSWYLNHGFDFVADYIQIGNLFFSHQPRFFKHDDVRFVLHGHLHNTSHHNYGMKIPDYNFLFSLEIENYKPVPLDEWVERAIKAKKERQREESRSKKEASQEANATERTEETPDKDRLQADRPEENTNLRELVVGRKKNSHQAKSKKAASNKPVQSKDKETS